MIQHTYRLLKLENNYSPFRYENGSVLVYDLALQKTQ